MTIHTAKDFGEMIRTARKVQGLTQQQIALAAGVGEKFVVGLEGGKPTCRLQLALLVAQTLGIRLTGEIPE